MKKVFVLILTVLIIVSCVFTACSKNNEDETTTESTTYNLENNDVEFGVETDENGNEVDVIYETDDKGRRVAYEVDKDGKKGRVVKVISESPTDKNNTDNGTNNKTTTKKNNPTEATNKPNTTRDHNVKPNNKVELTAQADTTSWDKNKIVVPKTTATGKEVRFSDEDMVVIEEMLEVPYLYLANYENSQGVPIEIATHTAIWMAEHEGSTRQTYPSSSIVLNLFRYYGQTVVDFKTLCNDAAKKANAPITYSYDNDTFKITEFTKKKQTVSITKIEDLGNDNFYKVTAKVSGCNKSSVVAVVQKNKLDVSLGFSIKALKWS